MLLERMTEHQIAKLMAENGFRLHRRAKRGVLWTDSFTTIMTSWGNGSNVKNERNMLADIERAKRVREQAIGQKNSPPEPRTQIEAAFKRFNEHWVDEPVPEEVVREQAELAEEEGIVVHIPPKQLAPRTPAPVQVSAETSPPQVPELFLSILTDPYLSSDKKVRMLTAYLED